MVGLVLLLAFIFGAVIGSFLNVFIFRYNTGKNVGGRSKCLHCGATLSWRELIPLVSFIVQGGRCRSCGAAISRQYPIVEFITGIVFLAVAYKELIVPVGGLVQSFQFSSYILYSLFYILAFCLLIAITAYDIRHKIIPNGPVWALTFISLVKVFTPLAFGSTFLYSDILAGPFLALPFALIWILSGGRAMGLGDAKLALGLGWMLGLSNGVSALLLSFWIGGAVGVYLLLRHRTRFTMKSELPFAPFLALSAFLAFLFNFDFFGLTNFFS